MGTLNIEATPVQRQPFDMLNVRPITHGATGGIFRLPQEFDTTRFSAQFVEDGNGVRQAKAEQPVVGTKYYAPGWQPWRYPEKKKKSKNDSEETSSKAKASSKAGKLHKVTESGKNGRTWVLVCRPLDVQKQVDQAYAMLSRERILGEQLGETIAGREATDPDNQGILTDEMISRIMREPSERDESLGASTVVEPVLPAAGTRLTGKIQRVSR